jgi:penicillin-binding protein 1A
MTWHTIMAYAHSGIEIKQLPGIAIPHERQEQAVALKTKGNEPPPPPRPVMLTKRGVDILVRLERMMDDANRALGPLPTVSAGKERQAQAGRKGEALAADLEGRAFERN